VSSFLPKRRRSLFLVSCIYFPSLSTQIWDEATPFIVLQIRELRVLVALCFRLIGGSDYRLIYRHYATLYFVFCVDSSESELGILDLIQVFVETLDKCFENVCELDLIFHVDKVHNILAEMVMGGMVLETNMNEIITQVDSQNKMEKSEAGIAGAPARAVSAVKNMNLPEMPRNINIGDISIKVPNLPSFK
uniref:AP complex mu/sigma subunit domain-containing protein n=1 Tax=Gasterosteus aculeatus aculeatus TaxID=481459 RepID=G3NS88_GASAC